jgi:hypothetical protein
MLSGESWEFLGDLLALDPTTKTGFDPTAKVKGTSPQGRQRHGFTSAGGVLFVHGGGVLEVGGVSAYENCVHAHVIIYLC